MTAPLMDFDAVEAFLIRTDGFTEAKFADAIAAEIAESGGAFQPCDTILTNTLYPMAYTLHLFGVSAYGASQDAAIRSWRIVARHLVDPASQLSQTDAQLLAWSIEALTMPAILADDHLTRRACKTILRLERQSYPLQQRARDLLRAIDATPRLPAAAFLSS